MYNHILYLLYWLINIFVLVTFNFLYPNDIVLGNARFNGLESAIYAGFWITVLYWAMWDFVHIRKINLQKESSKFIVFWAFNFIGYWLVARFSHIAGYGVSWYGWVLVLSLLTNTAQQLIWKMVVRRNYSS